MSPSGCCPWGEGHRAWPPLAYFLGNGGTPMSDGYSCRRSLPGPVLAELWNTCCLNKARSWNRSRNPAPSIAGGQSPEPACGRSAHFPARALGFPSGGPASQEPAQRDCPVCAGDAMAPSLINRSWRLIFPPPLTRVS